MPHDLLKILTRQISGMRARSEIGRITAIEEMCIWASRPGACVLGDTVRITDRSGRRRAGEIIRMRADTIGLLCEDTPGGLSVGDPVLVEPRRQLRPTEGWLGRVIDPSGRPMDGRPLLTDTGGGAPGGIVPDAGSRKRLGPRLATGLNVFDTLLPIARGQRIGLFAGSGVGKSRLLAALARGVAADVVVLALIGERGREVREFVEDVLGPVGLARSVVIAATSDRSPLERRRCLGVALGVAETFRDAGRHVLFLADSVTRHAEAHREIAMAAGELPALRGFPASMTAEIMALCERAGPGTEGSGDITAVFSVLVAGSDMDEPVADILRGTLDGHVVLDRTIAESGRYPAVDVLRSVSRSLPGAVSERELETLQTTRRLLNALSRSETMLRAGLYRPGTDPLLDQAVAVAPDLENFLASGSSSPVAAFQALDLILRRSARAGGLPHPRGDGHMRPTPAPA